jgi:HK97 family phage major capsid protein
MSEKWERLLSEAQTAAKSARQLYDEAVDAGRDLTAGEAERFDRLSKEAHAKKDESDRAKESLSTMNAVRALMAPDPYADDGDPEDAAVKHLSALGGRGLKGFAARVATGMRAGGTKAGLVANGDEAFQIPLQRSPVAEGQPAGSLFDVIGTVARRSPVYEYLRQTGRSNNAAVVAPGATKPTSSYEVTKQRGELAVVAHLAGPLDSYMLDDAVNLRTFVGSELIYGLRAAVEDEVVNGSGASGHLTGILATSGIQAQSFGADEITTLRSAVTMLESLGYTADGFVLNPLDWETIEATRNSSGGFDLAASGSPVDRAGRRVWGVPVAVSNAVAQGTGLALDSSAVTIDTDAGGIRVQWSNATGTDFEQNQTRARCEGRFGLSVYQPAAVVNVSLAAAGTG